MAKNNEQVELLTRNTIYNDVRARRRYKQGDSAKPYIRQT